MKLEMKIGDCGNWKGIGGERMRNGFGENILYAYITFSNNNKVSNIH